MLQFKSITADESESLATWLASDRWPFFLGHSPTQEEIRNRIADGEFFGDGCETFWIQHRSLLPPGLTRRRWRPRGVRGLWDIAGRLVGGKSHSSAVAGRFLF
jgi:hypothetical protein